MLTKRITLYLGIDKDHVVKGKSFDNLVNAGELTIESLTDKNNDYNNNIYFLIYYFIFLYY